MVACGFTSAAPYAHRPASTSRSAGSGTVTDVPTVRSLAVVVVGDDDIADPVDCHP